MSTRVVDLVAGRKQDWRRPRRLRVFVLKHVVILVLVKHDLVLVK